MACDIASNGPVVFVLWGTPELADLARILHEVAGVERIYGAGKAVYVARIPQDADAPPAHVRRVLSQKMPAFVERFQSYHVVLEGDGFGATIKRSALVGLNLLCRGRKKVFIHARHEEILREAPVEKRAHLIGAFRTFLPLGLLTDRVRDRPWLDASDTARALAR